MSDNQSQPVDDTPDQRRAPSRKYPWAILVVIVLCIISALCLYVLAPPDWLQRLIRPIYQDNFDLVCPIYRRQQFEGVLLRDLLYPMMRAIYGLRTREPYASEFAISGTLATDFISKETWKSEWCQLGPEIALTIAAVTGSYRVCQAFLGPKPQPDRSPRDLLTAMRRTVGAFFSSLDSTYPFWSSISGTQAIRTIGPEWESGEEPLRVNRKRLRDLFVTGVAELEPVYRSILSPATLNELQRIASLDSEQFEYSDTLWAKTVFEFAASYHKSVINRDHILQAMVPLYRGRTLAFLLANREGSGADMERSVEALCGEFERLKPYLLEAWADEKRGANA